MPAKRIIPCLDVKAGRVVKGIKFQNLRDAGDPVEAAARYDAQGADEVTYLDIAATQENRGTLLDLVTRTAARVFAPLTVGGGVRSEEDFVALLHAGADKVSVNSSAVKDPGLVDRLSRLAGAQALVVAIDVKRRPRGAGRQEWEVHVAGGSKPTGVEGIAWAREVAARGAGELLLTSMDRDGTQAGYDLELLEEVCSAVTIPVIASGGVGTLEHLAEGLRIADAALAASIFHDGKHTVQEAKAFLLARGIEVRP
ncbi:imidazole glycerol phosphate synthase subunit HisF [Anaeromyxobacter dehalogenans]|uniref:Imidazole glycerol phosphate synthase subunit HisF n=1 Tax=Anaeromyxobacter dehalogenans (strain 2CP-C) TaxID=290397 RepID=Q2INW1_ANADE|nr:imidazole glycerol phosphate synthase subunit HisF [Anaeromyxobacter dehalogenans]ABC80492.1 imidazole glycerol phosphate synthase subunit hisF [Anaeromyxobacter dehalogenans 2CP-C]